MNPKALVGRGKGVSALVRLNGEWRIESVSGIGPAKAFDGHDRWAVSALCIQPWFRRGLIAWSSVDQRRDGHHDGVIQTFSWQEGREPLRLDEPIGTPYAIVDAAPTQLSGTFWLANEQGKVGRWSVGYTDLEHPLLPPPGVVASPRLFPASHGHTLIQWGDHFRIVEDFGRSGVRRGDTWMQWEAMVPGTRRVAVGLSNAGVEFFAFPAAGDRRGCQRVSWLGGVEPHIEPFVLGERSPQAGCLVGRHSVAGFGDDGFVVLDGPGASGPVETRPLRLNDHVNDHEALELAGAADWNHVLFVDQDRGRLLLVDVEMDAAAHSRAFDLGDEEGEILWALPPTYHVPVEAESSIRTRVQRQKGSARAATPEFQRSLLNDVESLASLGVGRELTASLAALPPDTLSPSVSVLLNLFIVSRIPPEPGAALGGERQAAQKRLIDTLKDLDLERVYTLLQDWGDGLVPNLKGPWLGVLKDPGTRSERSPDRLEAFLACLTAISGHSSDLKVFIEAPGSSGSQSTSRLSPPVDGPSQGGSAGGEGFRMPTIPGELKTPTKERPWKHFHTIDLPGEFLPTGFGGEGGRAYGYRRADEQPVFLLVCPMNEENSGGLEISAHDCFELGLPSGTASLSECLKQAQGIAQNLLERLHSSVRGADQQRRTTVKHLQEQFTAAIKREWDRAHSPAAHEEQGSW